ncbi:MBL fold metallo-hydrolase [Paenibacillus sp. BK033]|uniref:MBL fold metallo-hydrolase n=1 Tax=Paenibacillus sp. BK033 TaxID=2512133 RepID=UPI001048B347|nr:MBL fold metallo-hydrolase [Paenibacillus sp. BK033]
MLEIKMKLAGRMMPIHPVVLLDEESWVLIDTGMIGNAEDIRAFVSVQEEISKLPLKAVILTHQDIDHIGGLSSFLEEEGKKRPFDVYAHEADRAVIDGEAPLLKFPADRLEAELEAWPGSLSEQYKRVLGQPSRPIVTRLMAEREILPFGGGLTVIHTPGHTPGHVSLYHQASKTLIAGDALVIHNGELLPSSPYSTVDMEQALQSVKKLQAYDIEAVVCYHGGLLRGGINKRIDKLAALV